MNADLELGLHPVGPSSEGRLSFFELVVWELSRRGLWRVPRTSYCREAAPIWSRSPVPPGVSVKLVSWSLSRHA